MARPGSLVLSYYQPWVYGGAERFTQLTMEELRSGRQVVFLYVSDAEMRNIVDKMVRRPEFRNLALYRYHSQANVESISPRAYDIAGSQYRDIVTIIRRSKPYLVRAHHPIRRFVDLLQTNAFRSIPVIYDVMDLWDDFSVLPWGDSCTEALYFEHSDAVSVVSTALLRGLPTNVKGYLVPNAIDDSFLRRLFALDRRWSVSGLHRKSVLSMGTMWGSWFDWDIVFGLVDNLIDYEFVFIGSMRPAPDERDGDSIDRQLGELRARKNVILIDEISHDGLVPWLCSADIGIVPFKNNALTAAVSPLKVFEYLAAGCIVVSSPMPDIRTYPGVFMASSVKEFVRMVEENDPSMLRSVDRRAIRRFCEANTWSARLRQLYHIAMSHWNRSSL